MNPIQPHSAGPGYVVAAATNLAATPVAADYTFAWATSEVNHVMLQNNTAAAVQWELDQTTTAGSPSLAAGQTVFLDVVTSALHLRTAAAQNVNGGTAANIVVRAWL